MNEWSWLSTMRLMLNCSFLQFESPNYSSLPTKLSPTKAWCSSYHCQSQVLSPSRKTKKIGLDLFSQGTDPGDTQSLNNTNIKQNKKIAHGNTQLVPNDWLRWKTTNDNKLLKLIGEKQ